MKKVHIDSNALEALYSPMSPEFEQRMLWTIQNLPSHREDRIVKRKISAGLVLALMLLLALTATALAFALPQVFFENVARLQLKSGYYDDWTLEEKLGILQMMKENGVAFEEEGIDEILQGGMDDAARERRLDELMANRYGGERKSTENIGVEDVLYYEMGPMTSWSLEDKAWYTRMMMDLDILGYDVGLNLLPGEEDISPEEAVKIARGYVTQVRALEEGAMDAYHPIVDFGIHRSEHAYKEPYYTIHFVQKEEDGSIDHKNLTYEYDYSCHITGEGRILHEADGYVGVSSPLDAIKREQALAEEAAYTDEERLDMHRAAARAVPAVTHTLGEAFGMEGAIALRDGTVLLYGATRAAQGALAGILLTPGEDANTPYALCLDEAGQTRWCTTLPEGGCFDGAMQLENGEILLYLCADTLSRGPYTLVRLGEQGAVLEKTPLPTTMEMIGVKEDADQDQNFAYPGRGGLLVASNVGQTFTYFIAQLDLQGKVVWARLYEELSGMAPRVTALKDGYLINGRKDGRLMLCWLDAQGQIVRTNDSDTDERLYGLAISRVQQQPDGSLLAACEQGNRPGIVRIAPDGKILQMQLCEAVGTPVQNSAVLPTPKGPVCAVRHNISEYSGGSHLCLIAPDDTGGLCECYLQDADDIATIAPGLYLLPIGAGQQAALLCVGYLYEGDAERCVLQMSVIDLPSL